MKKMSFIFMFISVFSGLSAISVNRLSSPDNRIRIEFAADSLRGSQGAPAYQVYYNGKVFLGPSVMGIEFAGQPVLTTCFKVIDTKTRENRSTWKPLYGEKEIYPDNYNEVEITMQETIIPNRLLKVVFRAYNEGIAFRYELPEQALMKNFTIIREVTEFAFKENTYVWQEYGHEGLYSKVLSSGIKQNCELPLTVLTSDSIYAVIAEAGNSDYPRAYMQPAGGRGRNNSIFVQLRGEAKGTSGYVTAWRTITLADRPGALIETMVKKAAEHHLMVDIHDAYRPNGFNRTYPNLITQEGIHGNEQTPNSDHTTTLPFTRYTIGAADFTPGYCRANLKSTWTHKLALPIIYYSPGMFLFWGEPLNEECHNRPELALWRDVPVVWSDTKVLQGDIGEFAVVARRTGNNWFVGGITNHSERTLQIRLDFLDPANKYEATIYTDSPDAKQVVMEKKKVNLKTSLSFPLLASGGFAIQIIEK